MKSLPTELCSKKLSITLAFEKINDPAASKKNEGFQQARAALANDQEQTFGLVLKNKRGEKCEYASLSDAMPFATALVSEKEFNLPDPEFPDQTKWIRLMLKIKLNDKSSYLMFIPLEKNSEGNAFQYSELANPVRSVKFPVENSNTLANLGNARINLAFSN